MALETPNQSMLARTTEATGYRLPATSYGLSKPDLNG